MKKVTFCALKTSLKFLSFFFFCKFSMKIMFYLPVNNDKPKVVAFFVFVQMLHLSLKFRLSKMSRNETPSWLRSQTVNSQGYSDLREPIKTRENCYSLI